MEWLNAKYARCPQCGEPINKFHRIQQCSITGELCCTRCIVSERFSPKIADDVPEEYRQKFRFWTILVQVIAAAIIYTVLASAWPSFVGWDTQNINGILASAARTFLIWAIVFIVLYPISAKLPHLGTWMWYWWIKKPENKEKVEKAIEKNKKGEYSSEDKVYTLKVKLTEAFKEYLIEKKGYYYTVMVLSPLLIIFFFVVRSDHHLARTGFSAFTGFILGLNTVMTLGMIWIASAFYSSKRADNQKNRLIIEWLSWGYVLLLPLASVPYPFGLLGEMGLIDQIPPERAPMFYAFYKFMFVAVQLIAMGLAYFLTRLKPDYDWKKNNTYEEIPLFMKTPELVKVKKILKSLLILFLLFDLLVIFALAHELLMVDFAMFFCVASYYFVGLYFIVIFALLKLVKRTKKDYFKIRNKYWTLVKVSLVIIIVNFLPTVMTNWQTNPSLDRQFDEVFGPDWETKITPEEYQHIPAIKYSMFDQYYGWDIPINAQYENIYMYDSPRYVKNATTGEIISNGTSKYIAIRHAMKFDAYLPAEGDLRVEFGDPETADVKYPVIIYVHGIGMDRGSGNANWTSQYVANMGYAVFDMSYGFTGWCSSDWHGGKERGYDYPDTIHQIGNFTKYLEQHADYFHADLSHVYFAGRSFGGWMCMNLAWLYNTTFVGGNFSSVMHVDGAIPYYPATDIPYIGSDYYELGEKLGLLDEGAPYIRGSSNPDDPDFNPEWLWYNALWQAEHSEPGTLAPVFGIQGTHDYLVPQGAMKRLESACRNNGHTIIAAYYPFGSHGFDALHFSHYGQSIWYYLPRFLALTH